MEEIESNGNGHSESAIPDKNLFRIGEVSRLTATKPFVLRYWETEFPMLQPVKSPKGHRLYRREDIDTVFVIKRLLYDEGFTIAGARRHLRDQARGSRGARSKRSGRDEWQFAGRRSRYRGRGERRGIRATIGGASNTASRGTLTATCPAQPQDLARPARLAPLIVDGF